MRYISVEYENNHLICPSCQPLAIYPECDIIADLPIDKDVCGLLFCSQCGRIFNWCDRCGALKESNDECGCLQPLLHWIVEAGMLSGGMYGFSPIRGEHGVHVPSEEPSGLSRDGSFHIHFGGTGRILFVNPKELSL